MAIIALCVGHKLEAQGAINAKYGLTEYEEATKVVWHAEAQLVQAGHVVHVLEGGLTHKINLINDILPDLALDVHFNADADHLDPEDLDDSRGTGCMVLYCPRAERYQDREPQTSRRALVARMSRRMANLMNTRDLGARPGWYWGALDGHGWPKYKDAFLRKTACPAIIPELGYIDNNAFAEEWLIENRHDELAEVLCQGIDLMLEGLHVA